jgi:L-lactate dehydrogenase complex protein LldG
VSSARDAFLQRVRDAVAAGNRPGDSAPIPPRGSVGYQGAGADPLTRFRNELTAAGGFPHLVDDAEAAAAQAIALAQSRSARRVLLGRGEFLDRLGLTARLRSLGVEVLTPEEHAAENCREPFFAADVGITGVDALIAETGSLVFHAAPDRPRSFSVLPPVHIAVAERSQLVPDLFDLFERTGTLPSCLTLVTGPSKTGDIELRLVTGVHGPGELHVVVADNSPLAPEAGARGRG